jgi:tRNA(fMet)-specific endonuclease VapC
LYGAYKSPDPPTSLKTVRDFIASFSSFPFNEEAAEVYGRIRYDLSKKGILIGPNDLMIASIAYSNGAILVTHNVREFGRVEGLKMEDWEENP